MCHKCSVGGSGDHAEDMKCQKPFSLVTIARQYLNFFIYGTEAIDLYTSSSLSCDQLRSQWTSSLQASFSSLLKSCTIYTLEKSELQPLDPRNGGEYTECVLGIPTASLVDNEFLQTGLVKYTSTIYNTKDDSTSASMIYDLEKKGMFQTPPSDPEESLYVSGLYELGVNGLYTSDKPTFYLTYMMDILPKEITISAAALILTSMCVLLYSRSLFISFLGLIQIMLAIPFAYFVYYFIFGITL